MSDPARSIAAVILAAGEARRFGGPKLLALLAGRPLVQHVVDAANASSADLVLVVVGAWADEVLAALRPGRAVAVRNPDYATGQASSLRAGLAAAGGADAAVVLLADMPGIRPALIDALAAAQRASGAAAVTSVWRGRRMPPTLIHRDLWPAIDALRGDVGAKDLLAGRPDVVSVEVGPALGALDDVDTPEDHARLAPPA